MHTHNWQVTSTVSLPNGTTTKSVTWGRTRAEARRKSAEQHRDAPHGVRVKTQAPVKYQIV
jgi:hypothetical protein